MEFHGFECSLVIDGTYYDVQVDSNGLSKRLKYEHLDFLHCHRKSHRGFVSYRDEVALVIDNDQVTQVLSNHSATGP